MVEVGEPMMVDGEVEGLEEELPTFEEIDRTILESCGYDESSPRYKMIFENVVADSDDEKIFTFDVNTSFKLKDAVDRLISDETFDNYWHSLCDSMEDGRDALLLEQLAPEFIGDEVRRWLNGMARTEKLNYVDLFSEILSKTENDETIGLIDFDDKAFDEMPNVVRIY